MKYLLSLLLAGSLLSHTFAEEVSKQASPFANAPWCKLPCLKIHLIVWGTILGTIGLQIILLYLLPRMKKMKKWQKYTVYGVLTVASITTAALILPQYLQDGFIIGRCFIGDPMGCQ